MSIDTTQNRKVRVCNKMCARYLSVLDIIEWFMIVAPITVVIGKLSITIFQYIGEVIIFRQSSVPQRLMHYYRQLEELDKMDWLYNYRSSGKNWADSRTRGHNPFPCGHLSHWSFVTLVLQLQLFFWASIIFTCRRPFNICHFLPIHFEPKLLWRDVWLNSISDKFYIRRYIRRTRIISLNFYIFLKLNG